MKIVFLDIDGVLNSTRSRKLNSDLGIHPANYIDMPCEPMVGHLNRILDETGAALVISSAWRHLFGHMGMSYLLYLCGVRPNKIIGMTRTVKLSGYRGMEIQDWLDNAPTEDNVKIESYVILDDSGDMLDSQKANFVQTDYEVGLTKEDADKAIKILNGGQNDNSPENDSE